MPNKSLTFYRHPLLALFSLKKKIATFRSRLQLFVFPLSYEFDASWKIFGKLQTPLIINSNTQGTLHVYCFKMLIFPWFRPKNLFLCIYLDFRPDGLNGKKIDSRILWSQGFCVKPREITTKSRFLVHFFPNTLISAAHRQKVLDFRVHLHKHIEGAPRAPEIKGFLAMIKENKDIRVLRQCTWIVSDLHHFMLNMKGCGWQLDIQFKDQRERQ